ncbi:MULTISPECIES: hypothetical protein [unclassified Pseudomonas]|uniref:hypothetical protein n=1 Tax=unclassified Pseudomonas TaxID=196821 RepID=UPI002448D478|nr:MULTISPECIES: hypothetical protein [unclassified Pseudomonas]MDG9928529.1 hypothetical protein [Pseudomonas sp. GD04042]MDH0482699.1 hypothetical protein [Pseudomonas sp. GD04015]MDH0604599.1 hypothetical protein [Pseudomonas sp. GD03869]
MAKQYIVKSTIHGIVKKGGKKVVIKSSPEPQEVPDALVKELLERGVIEEVEGGAKAKGATAPIGTDGDDTAPGSGDDSSGD